MRKVDVLVLGSGIAGLGAALKAREFGRDPVIFEGNQSAGGLLDNFEIQGFRFDNAVHLSFAVESKVREIFDQIDYGTHIVNPKSFERDLWLKHPVQNNLYPLTVSERMVLFKSFLERKELFNDDYESWLRHQYGDGISERFPIPYTIKYWDTHPTELSTTWIGDRMRRASLDEVLFGTLTPETPNTYYLKEVRYPKKGGFRSFISGLIDQSSIEYNSRAISLDLDEKKIVFGNDLTVEYQTLISSIPLPELVKITNNVTSNVAKASKKLKATSIDLISVGLKKSSLSDLWFYIYDEDILASRAYSPSLKSPENAPEGCSSLQFEIYSRGTDSKYDKEVLFENVVYALRKMKIAERNDIIFMHHKHLRYGNVIFDNGMEVKRDLVRSYFHSYEVQTIGRFGEWDYLWSNQSFMSGYNVSF